MAWRATAHCVFVFIPLACADGCSPHASDWDYTIHEVEGNAALTFEEPEITIVLEDVPLENLSGSAGQLQVSGIGVQSGQGCVGHLNYRWSYRAGIASFEFGRAVVKVQRARGRFTCAGEVFDIDPEVHLTLYVDGQGRVHKGTERHE